MSLEAIKEITNAEEKAQAARQEAMQLSKRMLADAQAAGNRALEEAAQRAQAELAEMKNAATEKARNDALELARGTDNRKAALLVRADSRREKAINLVVERIVRS